MRDSIPLVCTELQMISYHTFQSFGLFSITDVFSINVIINICEGVMLILIVQDYN